MQIHCGADAPSRSYTYQPGSGAGFLKDFQDNLRINILEKSDERVVFDLVGVDAAIANTFRRVLLAEVPTMAFETV